MLKYDLIMLISAAVALIHTLGVLSAVHAVASVRTPQGAIAWAVSLVTFPYVALPLYWIWVAIAFTATSKPCSAARWNRPSAAEPP